MYRYLFLMITLLTLMGCRDEAAIAPYLGPYYGGFDTAMTPDPGDDLNPNECSLASDPEQCSQVHGNPLSHLLMKLGIDEQEQLTLAFYRTQADYEAERPMYLSNACKTSVAPASFSAASRPGFTRPSRPQGVHTTISGTPAAAASVTVINAVDTNGADPPGT